MEALQLLRKLLDWLTYAVKCLVAIILAVMLVVSFLEVIRRYLFGQSYIWSGELVQYCIIAVAMLGGAVAYREKGLVAFDMVLTKLKGIWLVGMQTVINTICLVFSAYMLQNAVGTLRTPSIYMQTSIGLKISMFWPYLPIAVGLGLIVVYSLERYFELAGQFKGAKRGAEESGGEAEC